jgi:hypothetical protein
VKKKISKSVCWGFLTKIRAQNGFCSFRNQIQHVFGLLAINSSGQVHIYPSGEVIKTNVYTDINGTN